MKIVIISDIHDNQVNLDKCLKWALENKVDNIICLGDVTNSETLEVLAKGFLGDIYLVRGNAIIYDEEETGQYKNIKYFGKIGVFKLADKKIGICHRPILIDEILKNEKPNIVFYGHTHKPWIEKRNGVLVINPGTLGGMFSSPTFAYWDLSEKEPELKLLHEL